MRRKAVGMSIIIKAMDNIAALYDPGGLVLSFDYNNINNSNMDNINFLVDLYFFFSTSSGHAQHKKVIP